MWLMWVNISINCASERFFLLGCYTFRTRDYLAPDPDPPLRQSQVTIRLLKNDYLQ